MDREYEDPAPEEWLDGRGIREDALAASDEEQEVGPSRGSDLPKSALEFRMPMRSAAESTISSPAERLTAGLNLIQVEARRRQVGDAVVRGEAGETAPQVTYPAFPKLRATRSYLALVTFFGFVVLPVVVAAFYYTFLAVPQYVSEFHFSVRSATSTAPPSPSVSLGASSMSAMTGSSPSGPDVLSNYVVVDYISS